MAFIYRFFNIHNKQWAPKCIFHVFSITKKNWYGFFSIAYRLMHISLAYIQLWKSSTLFQNYFTRILTIKINPLVFLRTQEKYTSHSSFFHFNKIEWVMGYCLCHCILVECGFLNKKKFKLFVLYTIEWRTLVNGRIAYSMYFGKFHA